MKINEKNVIRFAMSNSAIDREGFLLKRGEINRSFQKRYFKLKGNLLFYFEKEEDKEPTGVIILEGCTVELAEDETEPYSFKVIFHGAGARTYILSAKSQEELEGWMKSIACAGYDYVKMMVLELEKQLEELTEIEKKNEAEEKDTKELSSSPVAVPRRTTSKRPQRINPFNKIPPVTESDIFCLNPKTKDKDRRSPSSDSRKSASSVGSTKESFVELHEQFGALVRKRIEQRKNASATSQ